MTLDELVDMAGQHARRVLINLKQDLMPCWALEGEDGRLSLLGTPWRNEREKEAAPYFIRGQLKKRATRAYSVMFEVWMATSAIGEPLPGDEGFIDPRKRPDRKEAVVAMATDGTDCAFRTWIIRRDHLEQIVELQLVERNPQDLRIVSSWALNLFEGIK